MTQIITCLKRVGENVKKYKLISFQNKDEVTIGRSVDATACLLSTVISRHHAVFKKQMDGTWTVCDNKSLNGVSVNGEKLKSQAMVTLQDGDRVQFGVATSPNKQAEFIFQFFLALKVKRQRPASSDEPDGDIETKNPAKRSKLSSDVTNLSRSDTEQSESMSEQQTNESSPVRPTFQSTPGSWSPYQQYKSKLKEQEKEAQEKLQSMEARMAELQKILEQKDTAQEQMKQELEKRERQTREMTEREEEMKKELSRKMEAEQKLREELDIELREKERKLKDQLQAQRESLLDEKQKIEECLQKQMESALEEKDKRLEQELVQQKERLVSVLAKKDLEQKLLETQLNETKAEKNKLEEATLRAREDVLTNFADLMEMELQCSICNELFVQATTLNCSHGFCALCIKQWMKRKKVCPMCRATITTHMRSIVLDSYIDKMLDNLNEDMKEKRKELIELRKAEQAKFDAENRPTTSGTRTVTVRGRGRGGRVRGRGQGGVMAQPPPPVDAEPIVVSEDSESFSEDSSRSVETDSDDSDGFSGESSAYYGGYGRCYACGSRGHWSNGCPFS